MYELYQYQLAYDNFVGSLDKKFAAAVDQRLARLALLGPKAGPKVSAHLEGGVFECRAQRNRRQARLLWFYMKGMTIVVAVALVKEGKVPRAAINNALAIKTTLEENPELIDELTEIH